MLAVNRRKIFLLFSFILIPFFANAKVVINEIMYDLDGADSDREWVEIYNDSDTDTDLSNWKFYDGSNHVLNEPPKNGGRGSLVIPAHEYAIFSANAAVFLSEHLDYSGILIDTVMNLNNLNAILKLIDKDMNEIDSISYNKDMGASGDGNSLQKINSVWVASMPTLAMKNSNNQFLNQDNLEIETKEKSIISQQTEKSVMWLTEPQIYANAGKDKTVVVGSEIEFSGKCLGLNGVLLTNGRYLWNFGDGAFSEGQKVKHVYHYPGEYIAVLNVSSGEYASSDAVNIKIIPNELKIIEANKDFIKIQNDSKADLDISGWIVRNENKEFKFPTATFIKAVSSLILSSEISRIVYETGAVQLLYSNGSLAYEFIAISGDVSHVSHSVANMANTNMANNVKNVESPMSNIIIENEQKGAVNKTEEIKLSGNFEAIPAVEEENYQLTAVADSVLSEDVKVNNWKWFVLAGLVGVISGGGYLINSKIKN